LKTGRVTGPHALPRFDSLHDSIQQSAIGIQPKNFGADQADATANFANKHESKTKRMIPAFCVDSRLAFWLIANCQLLVYLAEC